MLTWRADVAQSCPSGLMCNFPLAARYKIRRGALACSLLKLSGELDELRK